MAVNVAFNPSKSTATAGNIPARKTGFGNIGNILIAAKRAAAEQGYFNRPEAPPIIGYRLDMFC